MPVCSGALVGKLPETGVFQQPPSPHLAHTPVTGLNAETSAVEAADLGEREVGTLEHYIQQVAQSRLTPLAAPMADQGIHDGDFGGELAVLLAPKGVLGALGAAALAQGLSANTRE